LSVVGEFSVCRILLNMLFSVSHSTYTVRDVKFPNRIGVAAGFDKNAEAWKALLALGFGHVEVGTVTPYPQKGCPKPRIFRLQHASLSNRMGFPNQGVWAAAERLDSPRPFEGLVGVNIGPNSDLLATGKGIPSSYSWSMRALETKADYFTLNISSPNSVSGFQSNASLLKDIFWEVRNARKGLETRWCRSFPIFVKISPHLSEEDLETICRYVVDYGFDGLVTTNTDSLGVSGRRIKYASLLTLMQVREILAGELMTLVSVGGIESREDVEKRFEAGADLFQIYTSFVYQGPGVLRTLFPFSGT